MPSDPRSLDLLPLLLCPLCAALLEANGESPAQGLRCTSGHQYDGARQGYVNLLTGRGTRFRPDTAGMVAARSSFLDAGHYVPLAELLAETSGTLLAGTAEPVVLDAGAGTGYYLDRVLNGTPSARAVALDLSKFALRRAAPAVPAAICLVWDLWKPLPLAAGTVDLVLNVFAPRNADEFARVLRPGGHLVVATAAPGHLDELRQVVPLLGVDADKSERLGAALGAAFEPVESRQLEIALRLGPAEIVQLVMMGPNAHHTDPGTVRAAAAAAGDPLEVSARFTVGVFRRARGG